MEAHKKMLKISEQRLEHRIFHLLQRGGSEEMTLELKPLLSIRFMDIDKKKAFLSKRKALAGEKIYLDDDLTPVQVAQCERKHATIV